MAKQQIHAGNFLADVRAGMPDSELIEKYGLDGQSLKTAYKRMVQIGAMTQSELHWRMAMLGSTINEEVRRRLPRNYLIVALPVFDATDYDIHGIINDISEQGLQVSGIRTEVGEVRSLLIDPEEFAKLQPIQFDAVVRWAKNNDQSGEYLAGFEITDMTDDALTKVRELIDLLSF
jgi:hypothetical protein